MCSDDRLKESQHKILNLRHNYDFIVDPQLYFLIPSSMIFSNDESVNKTIKNITKIFW